MGSSESIIARRHRDENKMLSFTKATRDHLVIDETAYDVNSLIGTGSYYMEVKFRINIAPIGGNRGGIGNVWGTAKTNRFGWLFDSFGGLTWFSGNGFTTIANYVDYFINEMITLRVELTERGADTRVDFYVNGEECRQSRIHTNLVASDVSKAWINAFGSASTGAIFAGSPLDNDFVYVDFNGQKFNLNEGSGFGVTNTSAGTATGSTIDAGGLTYWDSDVWQENILTNQGVSIFDSSKFINSYEYAPNVRTAGSEYSFTTASEYMRIKTNNTLFKIFPSYCNLVILVDGVFYTERMIAVSNAYYYVSLPVGTKTVSIFEAITTDPTSQPYSGTFIEDIRLDNTIFTQLEELPSANKTIFLGDSITVGDGADYPSYTSYSRLFHKDNGKEVTTLGWGYGKLKDFASTPTLLAEFMASYNSVMANATANKTLVIALGTNDFGLDSTASATFKTWYETIVDEIRSVDVDVQIYCISPLVRSSETSLLGEYRTAISEVCTARSFCTYIDGQPILVLGDLGDGVHPSQAGHQKYKDHIYPIIYP